MGEPRSSTETLPNLCWVKVTAKELPSPSSTHPPLLSAGESSLADKLLHPRPHPPASLRTHVRWRRGRRSLAALFLPPTGAVLRSGRRKAPAASALLCTLRFKASRCQRTLIQRVGMLGGFSLSLSLSPSGLTGCCGAFPVTLPLREAER